jgi:hypothetical protein
MAAHCEAHLTHDSWERSRCTICIAGRTAEIDLVRIEKLLADGQKLKPLAAQFGVSWCSLRRHWVELSPARKQYLRFGSKLGREAALAAVNEEKIAAVDHFRLTRSALHKALWSALQSGNFHAVATLAGALDRNIEAATRLTGEWPSDAVPHSITNNILLSDVAQLLQILKPYPDAARAIVDHYRGDKRTW